MKNKTNIFVVLLVVFSMIFSIRLTAKDLKASLAIIPVQSERGSDGKAKGGFVEVAKAIGDVYEDGNILIEQYPFARSIANVIKGKADFHIPLIKTPHISLESLPFAYSTERITQVSFVLYTRADKAPLDISQFENKLIETQRGHKELFKIKVGEVDNIEQGIKKLVLGRNDGFIMEQDAVDDYIKRNKIKNIRRTLYAVWDSNIVIPKGPKQKEIDGIISNALKKLKASGRLEKIIKTIHQPYIEWQPYKMDW